MNLYDNGISKEGSYCICLSVIMIDSVFKIEKISHLQESVEECKYFLKERKLSR